MKNFESNAYVVGSSALQPRCSRYSNENERIIEFPQHKNEPEFYSINYKRLSSASHVRFQEKCLAKCMHFLQKNTALYDLLTGDLKGKALFNVARYKVIGVGLFYSLLAVCALFIAV